MIDLQSLEKRLWKLRPRRKHDEFAIETIKEAIDAIRNGNWGVGAVLVDNKTGKVIFRGQNKTTRTDWHAEMDLLNKFEDEHGKKGKELLRDCTLYTSLEPCPMCLCRIIVARVGAVYYVADDKPGGMVHLRDQLPQAWKEMSNDKTYEKADCSDELVKIAEELFHYSLNESKRKKESKK